ncbi:MAG: signal peptidase I [Pikeienuella sp.]
MARKQSGLPDDGVWEVIKTVVYALLIAVVFRTFLFQPFYIPSGSMKSTLLIGDYLFVSKYSYGVSKHSFPFSLGPFDGRLFGSEPERGDVVVFRHPRQNEDFIKRLVGLPGDRIEMRNGILFINGEAAPQVATDEFIEPISGQASCSERRKIDGVLMCVKEAAIETLPGSDGAPDVEHLVLNVRNTGSDNTRVFTVPAGHYFMVGDNRDNSNDSRAGVGMVPFENLLGKAQIIAISSEGRFYEIWNWRFGRSLTVVD